MHAGIRISIAVIVTAALCFGQTSPNDPQPAQAPVELPIQDNSFLLEEAYNQEDGVIQHISAFQRMSDGSWVYSFTDEWPVRTQKHQLSFTALAAHSSAFPGSGAGWGDVALNYRYQLIGSGETRLAFSPRISALLPAGDSRVGRGFGGAGLQVNLPASIAHSRHVVTHWNLGTTWVPNAKNEIGQTSGTANVNAGQSTIWLVSRNFNAMLETVWASNETIVGSSKTLREQSLFLNPGVRFAINTKSGLQIVPGFGVPVGIWRSSGERGVFFYLSFEHPFAWAKSR